MGDTLLLPFSSNRYSETVQLETERFIQFALDSMSAHIAILDRNGQIIGVNAAWRHFAKANNFQDTTYGIGTNYLAVCDSSADRKSRDAVLVASGIRDVIAGQREDYQLEYPCHSPTQKRWFVVRISRFDWYDDMRVIVAHQNVTELKSVQIALAESKSRIEAVLDNISNGIITVDANGMIETANPMAARIFGYPMTTLLALPFEALLDGQDGLNPLVSLRGDNGHEITGRRADGSSFPLYVAMNEVRFKKHGAKGTIYTFILMDITERKRIEAELIEKERMAVALDKERELRDLKNRFLSMMSHELRTPLASIRLSSDMLKQYGDRASEEEKRQYLDNIEAQVEHLAEMVRDVITISQTESESERFAPEEVDLITFCRGIVEEFQLVHHRTHTLDFECAERVIRSAIDKKLMRRALTNLLANAIKYSPEGGQILFELGLEDDGALIRVRDSGIGIPEEDHARLFEPFHRAANAEKLPGTGLGLAITRQSVEIHGGTIYFESKVGSGTSFWIYLPLSR